MVDKRYFGSNLLTLRTANLLPIG